MKQIFKTGTAVLSDKHRNNLIDAIKAVSIFFIIFTHYSFDIKQRALMFFPFWVDQAVPIFMIISGYLYASSFSKMEVLYTTKNIVRNLVRFIFPFIFIYLIYVYLFSWGWNGVILFFKGGVGPGSYYFPVMLQFVFIYPLIFWVVKKYSLWGVFFILYFNFLFEIFCEYSYFPRSIFRLLVFRYIFVISLGAYMYLYGKNIKIKYLVVSLLLGLCYLYMVNYTKITLNFINDGWKNTNYLSAFYIFPIIYVLLKVYPKNVKKIWFNIIGKASYNIYLIQMLYYKIYVQHIYYVVENKYYQILINLILCSVLGVLFYVVEVRLKRGINIFISLVKKR